VSNFQDKELTCSDCRGKFLHSAKDQEFFAEKGFSEPKRCKPCRQAKKEGREDRRGDNR
jgi:Probable zinc-ribbon domain